jgi:hypothetical protein
VVGSVRAATNTACSSSSSTKSCGNTEAKATRIALSNGCGNETGLDIAAREKDRAGFHLESSCFDFALSSFIVTPSSQTAIGDSDSATDPTAAKAPC